MSVFFELGEGVLDGLLLYGVKEEGSHVEGILPLGDDFFGALLERRRGGGGGRLIVAFVHRDISQ